MKTCKISIVRKSQTFAISDLQSAIDWLLEQAAAVDVADCEEVSAHKKMGLTDIHFNLITTPDPPAPAPPPAPEPEQPSTTEDETPTEPDPVTDGTDPTP
jgi:hypothetical protein